MKKQITAAALLAAGAAFAGAAEFVLVSNNSSAVGADGISLTGGRATFSSIDGQTGLVYSAAEYSYEISFSVKATTTMSMVYSSGGGGSGSGYCIGIQSVDGGYTIALKNGESGIDDKTQLASITSSVADIKLSWDASEKTLTLSSGSVASEAVSVVDVSGLDLTTNLANNIADKDAGGVSAGSVFWTNSGANPISNISLTVSAIPEPSAFGLLAGAGALALVAARRRRSK